MERLRRPQTAGRGARSRALAGDAAAALCPREPRVPGRSASAALDPGPERAGGVWVRARKRGISSRAESTGGWEAGGREPCARMGGGRLSLVAPSPRAHTKFS